MSTCAHPPIAPPKSAQPRSIKSEKIAQALVLVILYAIPALICVHTAFVSDADIWWHLRTGQWITQHHAIPRTDPYSSAVAGKPWAAYSWLFELLVFQLFHHLGLAGIVAYTAGMLVAITAAIHHLVRRLQPDPSVAIVLTYLICFSIGRLYTPRPWLFTILFFAIELDILLHARKTGRLRELLWLPILFALWANLHIQFIDGLVLLALALAESVFTLWRPTTPTRLRPAALAAIFAACILATFANPYGWHIYQIAHDLAAQPGVLNGLSELQAIPFRELSDYGILFLTLASAAVLAYARRLQPFETALFLFAAILAFRSQRDVWIIAITAAAILAATRTTKPKTAPELPAFTTPLAAVLAALLVFLGFQIMQVTNEQLQAQVTATFPARAVAVAQSRGYTGPIFNDYTWGGYLIWSLRQPVSIDGRAALYGDQRMLRSGQTWAGSPDWAADPQLQSAHLVIAPINAPLTQLLRQDPAFALTYEDQVAALFIPAKK